MGLSLDQKARAGTLNADDVKLINELDSGRIKQILYSYNSIAKYRESRFDIFVETSAIRNRNRWEDFVPAKAVLESSIGFNQKVEIECVIACPWDKLGNLTGDRINLLDFFKTIFPNGRSGIGLCTFQNGIQNSLDDFKKMGAKIAEKFKEFGKMPLCLIGFYNETSGMGYGFFDDLQRLRNEWHLNVNSVLTLRQMIYTFEKLLPSNHLWAHICHSEGGLIAHEVVTTQQYPIGYEQNTFIKSRMIISSYGAVEPIPNQLLETINTYSVKDITMFFAKKYLDKTPKPLSNNDKALKKIAQKIYDNPWFNKNQSVEALYTQLKNGTNQIYIEKYPHHSTKDGYTLTIVESEEANSHKIEGDHAFDGQTYQKALYKNIEFLYGKYHIL